MFPHQWEGLVLSSDDVARKFASTYVYGTYNESKPHTYQIGNNEGWSCTLFYKGVGKLESLQRCDLRLLDIIHAYPPVTGAFQHESTVGIVKRQPARQWQVGVCRANIMLWDENLEPQRLAHDVIESMFTATYPRQDVHTILKEFQEDKKLRAKVITNRYWLKRAGKDVALYRNMICLGSFVLGSFFVNAACQDLKQELWDDLRIKVAK
jgi:hypothetical protein